MKSCGAWLWRAGSVIVVVCLGLLWQWVTDQHFISPVFLPGLDRVGQALARGLSSGDLTPKVLATIERMLWGWFIASLIGILLGAMIGISPRLKSYLAPILEFLRPLPASAIVPVVIALLGLTDAMILSVVGFGALWPVLLATVHGFSAVDPRLYEVGRALRMSKFATIYKIALPSAMPDILSGMRLSLTVALILSVVCEMISGREGLGNWILLSARFFRSADLYAGVLLLGLIGYASAFILSAVDGNMFAWRRRRGDLIR
ncbi:ABC transporter permease [Bradyrhizobium sp. 187]|uniref:ABC transporter permease n=1 Tax=Bradyrhizobium sp. 187 TaxID=2782655 RepID=UPI0020004E06|nr:ABC transporter permease [Bradyrhizobium sp. 187]UPJ71862.1 ABC transporter permease [Bradyrhizobium sp. 187]